MIQFKNDHYQIHYNGYSIIFTIKKTNRNGTVEYII